VASMEPVQISDESAQPIAVIYIDPRATILQLKLVIARNCSIPVEEQVLLKRSVGFLNDEMTIGDIPRPIALDLRRVQLVRSRTAVTASEVGPPAPSQPATGSLETASRAVSGAEMGILTAIGIAVFPSACLGFCTLYLSCLCTPCCGQCMEQCCLGIRNFIVKGTQVSLVERIADSGSPVAVHELSARSAAADGIFLISTTVLALPLIPPLALTGGLLGACAGLTFDTAGGCTWLQSQKCSSIQ